MLEDRNTLGVIVGLSLALSIYLLYILYGKLRSIYGSIWAWRFIFLGHGLLAVETLIGLALVYAWLPVYARFFNFGFALIMLTKVAFYVVGFSLWANKRRKLMDPKRWDEEE